MSNFCSPPGRLRQIVKFLDYAAAALHESRVAGGAARRHQKGDDVREIASKQQLRMAFMRWAVVTVPFIMLLGFTSARSVPTGADNRWYMALAKPEQLPPDWAFPVAWGVIYALMGLALALIINARGSQLRTPAIALFAAQMVPNLIWTPLFFGAHLVFWSLVTLGAMFALALATTIMFGRIRLAAAVLLVPYVAWIVFAGYLTYQINMLNPDAATLVPPAVSSQIIS